jgi:myxalamid-type polyketide synthase MxaC
VAALLGVRYRLASRAALRRAAEPEDRAQLFTVTWRPSPIVAAAATEPGRWLILANRSREADPLAQQLESAGGETITVVPGPGLAQLAARRWQVDPGRPDEIAQVVRAVVAQAGAPFRGIVHLWGLDAGIEGPTLGQNATPGLQSGLALVQALVRHTPTPAAHLWIVTAGAQPAGDPASLQAPGQAALWGLGRTIAHEYPELWGGLVDLEPGRLQEGLVALAQWLIRPDGEDEMAWRAGVRLVPRLGRHELVLGTTPQLDSGSTYLITGGLGGLGLRVARWMIDQGARHLVLASRHDPSAAARETLRLFEQAGAQVIVAPCDVAQEHEVASLFGFIATQMPPLRGLVHAAGILDDGVLLQQNGSRFEQVVAPKVAGAWHLHQYTRQLPLDFFVLFSSVAGLLGSPGQSSYAAANAYLDALGHYRRAQGLAACSINWGPWAQIGMAARSEPARRHRVDQGIGEIAPEDGLRVLAQALRSAPPQIAMLPVDWEKYSTRPGGRRLVIADLGLQGRAVRSAPPNASPDLRRRLAAASPRARREQIDALIQAQAARLLGLDPGRALDPQQPLQELGLDSLMSIDLRNGLGAALGLALPATLLFDYPTTGALGSFLDGTLAPSVPAPDATDTRSTLAAENDLPSEQLTQLSQGELEALLDERLEQIDKEIET